MIPIFDSFNSKLDSLLELLQSITTPSIEVNLLNTLLGQIRGFNFLNTQLIQLIQIANPNNNYDNKLMELGRKLVLIDNNTTNISIVINIIVNLGNPNIQEIDSNKQNKLMSELNCVKLE